MFFLKSPNKGELKMRGREGRKSGQNQTALIFSVNIKIFIEDLDWLKPSFIRRISSVCFTKVYRTIRITHSLSLYFFFLLIFLSTDEAGVVVVCYCLHAHMDEAEMKTHSTKAKQNIRKWVSVVGNRLGPGLKSTTRTWLKLKTFVARERTFAFFFFFCKKVGACARLDRSQKRCSQSGKQHGRSSFFRRWTMNSDDDAFFRARNDFFFFFRLSQSGK